MSVRPALHRHCLGESLSSWTLELASLLLRKPGIGHLVPLHMTEQLVLKETGFYLQGSNLRGAKSTLAQNPPFPQDPEPPLPPKRLQAKTTLRSSPSPHLSNSWSHKQNSILWNVHLWVPESPSSQREQLSPSGSGVCWSQPPCSGSGKHVSCYMAS